MKNIIKPVALILSVLFIAAMCACASGGSSETTVDTSDEKQIDTPAAGVYSAFGMSFEEYPDYVIDSAEYLDTVITLNEDGTGIYTTEGESIDIDSWTANDGKITVKTLGEDASGTVKNGILILNYYDCSIYFAKDGADKSSVKLITADEFEEKLQEEMPDDEAKDE